MLIQKGRPKAQSHTRVKSNSAKQVVATKEVERLKAVASHAAFQQDPHKALREHLKATLAAQIAEQRAAGQARQQQQAQPSQQGRAVARKKRR